MSMRTIVIMIAFTLAGLVGMAQTNQPLPPDAQPLTALTYLSPSDSTVWLYNERSSLAINVGVWADVVELFETGWSNTQIDSAIAAQIGDINFPVTSVNSMTGDVVLAPTDLGLGNVDNTSDADKPVSNATQDALDGKENAFGKGDLVAGSNVTMSGTLESRLVGSGNITINVPTLSNVVTTNTDQSNIGNNKGWNGVHSFSTAANVGDTQNTVYIGSMTAGAVTGMVMRASNYSSSGLSWELRNYAHPSSGVQLVLNAGGISSAGPISAPNLITFDRSNVGFVPAPGGSGTTRFLREDGSWSVPSGGGGGGTATDLSVGTRTSTTMVIGSSTGSGATLPSASTTQAGLLSAADKVKINGFTGDYLPLSGGTISNSVATPLTLNRTTSSQVSLRYSAGVDRYLGITTDGELRFGAGANLEADGWEVWHSGNLDQSIFAKWGTTASLVRNNAELDDRYLQRTNFIWDYLSGKPSTFTPSAHTHNASDINAGTLSIARIPTGTSGSTVALGNHTHSQYVPTSRSVSTGLGLTGGGNLTASRTLSLDLASLPAASSLSTPRVVVTNGTATGSEARMTPEDFATAFSLATTESVLGRMPKSWTLTAGDGLTGGGDGTINRTLAVNSTVVRTSRTINGKALSANVTLTAADVGAAVIGTGSTQVRNNSQLDARYLQSVSGGSGINVSGGSTVAVDGTVLRTTGNQTVGGTKTFSSPVVAPQYQGTSTTASGNIPTDAQSLFKASISSSATYTLTNLSGSPRHIQVMVTNTGSSAITLTFNATFPVNQTTSVNPSSTAIFTFLINGGIAYGTKTQY